MDNNTIVSISSIVVAVLALITTLWQGIVARKHNRLSITPHLGITRRLRSDWVSFELKNSGIGPAIIKSYIIKINGKLFFEKGPSMYHDVCKLLDVDYSVCKFYYPDINQAISPNEAITLLEIDYSSKTIKSLPPKIQTSLGIVVEYTSIYEESFSFEYSPVVFPAG